MAFRVEVLSFAAWTAAWSDPAAASGRAASPFQSPTYLAAWLDTIGRARGTRPVFVRVDAADGRRVMLLALGIERRRGLKVLGFLDGGVVDYAAPVRLGPAAREVDAARARALWAALCAALPAFDVAVLDKMPAEVEGVANPLAPLAAETAPSGWAIELTGGFEDFQRGHNPYTVDSRRKRRRLQDLGPLAFTVAEDAASAGRFLEAMIAQKTRKYLDTLGVDGFDAPGYRDYFAGLTARPELDGMVHLSALTLGDRVLAAHWGLVSDDAFYYLMPAYEPGPLARYSPGRLLMEDLVAWCYARGVRRFDFGHGDDGYKTVFRAARRKLLRLEAPGSPAGRAALALRRSPAARKLEALARTLIPLPQGEWR